MRNDLLKEIIFTPTVQKVKTVKHLLLTRYAFTVNTLDGEVTNECCYCLPWNMFLCFHFENLTHSLRGKLL